ncbi:MAG: sigma-70 family RNA polymerase sigma factor [Isosphaeraceae bacterium]
MSHIREAPDSIERGGPGEADCLVRQVYDALRKLAAARLASVPPGQTLQATALVHEAYARIVGSGQAGGWNGRGHFFAAASEAMRRILVENARRKDALKRGGGAVREDLNRIEPSAPARSEDLLALDEALERLRAEHPRKAELVTLRYFGGLSMEQAAEALGIAPATAWRDWNYARAWLHREIAGPENSRDG